MENFNSKYDSDNNDTENKSISRGVHTGLDPVGLDYVPYEEYVQKNQADIILQNPNILKKIQEIKDLQTKKLSRSY